ncbi:hypothetical protein ABL78_1706 [Leptomonas seymouri]|uniref:Uncharacterized protein n=1 Tax=Leptomonas seymouri TaxID=5684 RepID=A0A0N1IM86_LEPSE|nr:hypothetical protein ABL78_1706 [Leptomonas seymouri]|eukprot:KPI89213.1 hypothetical protein ABL78_1706 [Leptomonas seymouri]
MLRRLSSAGGATVSTWRRVRQWPCESRGLQLLGQVAVQAAHCRMYGVGAPAVVVAERSDFAAPTMHTSRRHLWCSTLRCAPSQASPPPRGHRNSRHVSKHRKGSHRSGSEGSAKATTTQGGAASASSKSRQRKRGARAAEEVPVTEAEKDKRTTSQHQGEAADDLFKAAVAPASGSHDDAFDSDIRADTEGAPAAYVSASPESEQGVGQLQSEPGWGLESVNATTGKTALEELYDRNLSRIHSILEKPLPPMPQDGSVNPDFFVGFASYNYQLRDQYRAVIARELHVPVRAVRLSVAWSGRFNVKRFGRVQKVCGVCLDRAVVLHASEDANEDRGIDSTDAQASTDERNNTARVLASDDLPDALQQRIAALISAINANNREDLLQVQLFQASPPIPEVEFALSRQEHRLVYHLHEWIRRHVLQRVVAVVVYGMPPSPLPPQRSTKESTNTATMTASEGDVHRHYALWLQRASEASAAQYREVQSRWLRLFHRRKVVPAVLSLTELATGLAIAVVDGDVPGVGLEKAVGPSESEQIKQSDEEAVLLSGSVRDLLMDMASAAAACAAASTTAGGGKAVALATDMLAGATGTSGVTDKAQSRHVVRDLLLPRHTSSQGAEPLAHSWSLSAAAQQEAALRWVRLVFQALLLRETHSGQTATGTGGAASTATTTPTMAADVSLPALFSQGVYAGSRNEVAYLQHNRVAMDALLLHPHEISLKKKFMSRLRNGHLRPRMEEEAAALHYSSG